MIISLFNDQKSYIGQLSSNKTLNTPYETCLIDENILNRAGKSILIVIEKPILDLHGYWTPDLFRPKMQQDWLISFASAAHRNFPFMVFFNQAQQNRGAIGIGNLLDDAEISAKMNQQTGNYIIEFRISISSETKGFYVFIDLSDVNWPETVRRYRSFVRPDWKPEYPDAAWKPVYCTWYAVHAEMTMPWLEAQSGKAAELGFGTFIVDDGWCIDEFKRVSPATIGNWYDRIGDWQVSEKKLPGFKQHVKRARNAGLKYLLWISPFMIGTQSQFYAETDCAYLTPPHKGYRIFDPADQATMQKSMNLLLDTFVEYGLDGFKIDFVDAVPQSLENPKGREVYNYLKILIGKIREANPEALFEFRQRYTTPAMLDLATQFRAGDVPFDFIENLHRIAQIRICAGNQVPVHADPVFWHEQESLVNITRHMMSSLAGVPMVSMDLNKLPEEQLNIIRLWLDFYNEHLVTFRNGQWEIRYDFDRILYISVKTGTETILFINDSEKTDSVLRNFTGNLYVLNLGNTPIELDSAGIIWEVSGKSAKNSLIPAGGKGFIVK